MARVRQARRCTARRSGRMARVRQARRCTARRSDGTPCRCYAIVGGRVCRVHGGAGQVRAAAERRVLQARTNVICEREVARHELDLLLWQQARREVAAELLGLPADQVTRRDLVWANLRFGQPPLAHQAPSPRWRR